MDKICLSPPINFDVMHTVFIHKQDSDIVGGRQTYLLPLPIHT